MNLDNSIGKGGNCLKTSECKGNLQCLQGICSSVKVDLDINEFASAADNIASEREAKDDDSLFKNPLTDLVEESQVDLEDLQKIKCKDTKECLKYDKQSTCVRERCEKKYKGCDIKNRIECSKLGDVSDFDKSEGSFIKTHGCCVDKDHVCVNNPDYPEKKGKSDGICVGLKSSLDFDYSLASEYNLPNKSDVLKIVIVLSGFCNTNSKMCESIFQASRECDSLYPYTLSEECVNGKCVPVEKLPADSAKSHSSCTNKKVCGENKLCLGTGSPEDRDKLELSHLLIKDKPLFPVKKSIRLFSDTTCGNENIKNKDFPFGVCEIDAQKIVDFQSKMKEMKDAVYKQFKSI